MKNRSNITVEEYEKAYQIVELFNYQNFGKDNVSVKYDSIIEFDIKVPRLMEVPEILDLLRNDPTELISNIPNNSKLKKITSLIVRGVEIKLDKKYENKEAEFLEIIRDELGRGKSTYVVTNGGPIKDPGNDEILCAMRLLMACGRKDFNETIKLANIIHDSWTDLELSEKQEQDIINGLTEIIKQNNGG